MSSLATLATVATLGAREGDCIPWGVGWLRELARGLGPETSAVPWDAVWLVQFFVVTCVAFHVLERFGPRIYPQENAGPFHHGWRADLTAAIVHGPVLAGLLEVVAIGILLGVPALARPDIGDWPWLLQFGVFFLTIDFLRYWLHRWHHVSPLLWRFHRVHHSASPMTFFTSSRFHLGEALLVYVLLPLPFKLLGLRGSVILVYAALDLTKGFWQHANLRTPIGLGNLLISSSEQHWWHHAASGRGMHSNFGSFLSIWDLMFGTFYWRPGEWPERIGVAGIEDFPPSYVGRLVSMLRSDEDFRRRACAQGETPPDGATMEALRPVAPSQPSAQEAD
jgi:sterol desaturase/sphingolipid hydroxylase (fatty acid hydroxylase superfamily)